MPQPNQKRGYGPHRLLVLLAVGLVGLASAFYTQKGILSLHTAPIFAAALLALFATGEITVRILDFCGKKQGQALRDQSRDGRVRDVLENASWGSVVLHNIAAGKRAITHLVFRPEGVVFLVESDPVAGTLAGANGEITLNGRRLPAHLVKETQRKVDWVRQFLRAQLGCDPRVEAGLVFPNAEVAACYRLDGVALLGLDHLQPWLETSEPNEEFGRQLWQGMVRIKTELLAGSRSTAHLLIALPAAVVLVLGTVWLIIGGQEKLVKATPALIEMVGPVVTAVQDSPSKPAWLEDIRLEGLGGTASKRLAIINRKTVAAGEGATIKVGERDVYIRCLEISGETATISVTGVDDKVELRMGDN